MIDMVGARQRGGHLHAQVVDDLGLAIVSGRLRPGDLVDPVEVGQRLGVSRSVIREAFRVLGSLDLIAARHKTGTRVLPRSEWNLLDPSVIRWRTETAESDQQLRELLQLRASIEPLAARLSAGRLDAGELETLERACDALELAARTKDRAAFLRADELFHATILENCGNEILARFSQVVLAALRARQHESRATVTEQTPPSLALHRRLFRALASAVDGDANTAGRRAERVARELVELATIELGLEVGPQ
jgi:DNA-binding FadR family transcriptional regulator